MKRKFLIYVFVLVTFFGAIRFTVLQNWQSTANFNSQKLQTKKIFHNHYEVSSPNRTLTTKQEINTSPTTSGTTNHINKSDEKPFILLCTPVPLNISIPSQCGGGCDLSLNLTDIDKADAVVVQMKFRKEKIPKRSKVKPNQIFVWLNRESSWTTKVLFGRAFQEYNNYFNYTMTYRRDSDINAMLVPIQGIQFVKSKFSKSEKTSALEDMYDQCQPNDINIDDIRQLVAKKTKTVAWAANDCTVTAGAKKRLSIVHNLKEQNLTMDTYGHCGEKKFYLPSKIFYQTLSQYKFYLSFENGYHCKDYITEKLWYNAFYVGAVPVIWGPEKSDLEEILPENSYIFIEDFSTLGSLVSYLQYLLDNEKEYLKYFEWRLSSSCFYPLFNVNEKTYVEASVEYWNNFVNGFCELCKKLNDKSYLQNSKVIPSLAKYWYGPERKDCLA